jgi:hypothetical protein
MVRRFAALIRRSAVLTAEDWSGLEITLRAVPLDSRSRAAADRITTAILDALEAAIAKREAA